MLKDEIDKKNNLKKDKEIIRVNTTKP